MVERVRVAALEECDGSVCVRVFWTCVPSSCEPWLPFYSLKGKTGFYKSRFLLLNGENTVPTLLRLVHLVLEGWLTAWLLL